MEPRQIAQRILDGQWEHAAAAVRACQSGRWAEFVREVAPRKPLLVGRADYVRCIEIAEASLMGPVTSMLTIVPLWACSAFETGWAEWVAVHGVTEDAGEIVIQEMGPFVGVDDASPRANALWDCTVRQWSAATVVETQYYSRSIPLRLRAGAYGVLDGKFFEVVSVTVRDSEPLPRPTHAAPMFTTLFEPRVRVTPELLEKIRAACITDGSDGSEPP
jgi:hypothetical protein